MHECLHSNDGVGASGATLVELMVSVALFSLIGITMGTLFAEHAKRSVISDNESKLTTQTSEFTNALEAYIGNATRIHGCNCDGSTCVFSESTTDCMSSNGDCDKPLLEIETEVSGSPEQETPVSSGCILDVGVNPNTNTPEGLYARGCKRKFQLNFEVPTPVATGTPKVVGDPGTLSLVDVTSGTAVTKHELSGVYYVRCGMSPVDSNSTAAVNHFRLEAKVKSRNSNLQVSTDASLLEGWHPDDTRFNEGTHRELGTTIAFRNLGQSPVHFGMPESRRRCVTDGFSSTDGNCCSGYMDSSSTCLAMNECLVQGVSSGGVSSACCSHMTDPSSGACL